MATPPTEPWDLLESVMRRIGTPGVTVSAFELDLGMTAARALESECYMLLHRGSRCEDLERVAFWMIRLRRGDKPTDCISYLPQRILDAVYGPGKVRQNGDWSVLAQSLGRPAAG